MYDKCTRMFKTSLHLQVSTYSIGPRSPFQTNGVRFTETSHSSATVEWRVPFIAYTPEVYHVEYGLSPTELSQSSQTVGSGSDFSVTNQLYSINLVGLTADTTYYYQVVATNSYASNQSSLASFTSVTLRKFLKQYIFDKLKACIF